MSRLVRVLDDKDVVERLRSSAKKAGGQSAYSRQTGLDRTDLNHTLTGKHACHRGASLMRLISASFMLLLVSTTA